MSFVICQYTTNERFVRDQIDLELSSDVEEQWTLDGTSKQWDEILIITARTKLQLHNTKKKKKKICISSWWQSPERRRRNKMEVAKKCKRIAPAANRTRGPSMATMDFTTKPLALF